MLDCPICPARFEGSAALEAHVNEHLDGDTDSAREAKPVAKRPRQDGMLQAWLGSAGPPVPFLRALVAQLVAAGLRGLRMCHPSVQHFAQGPLDAKWGCGYRNLQMMLSALHGIGAPYADVCAGRVPDVAALQRAIEDAWRRGYDPEGAAQLNRSLAGTSKWIGATEVCAVLRAQNVRARLADSHVAGAHAAVGAYIASYFAGGKELDSAASRNAEVTFTDRPPVYLQYQGHSRTVVGVDRDGRHLIFLDPSIPASLAPRGPRARRKPHERFLWPTANLHHAQYQLVVVDGVYATAAEQAAGRRLASVRLT